MNVYIKVPPKVAQELKITQYSTCRLPDGNYSSMFKQFEKICPPNRMLTDAPLLGCAILRPNQNYDEKHGNLVTPLPRPLISVERYKMLLALDPNIDMRSYVQAHPEEAPEEVTEEVTEVVVEEIIEEAQEEPNEVTEEEADAEEGGAE